MPLSKSGKLYVTQEQRAIAEAYSALEYAQRMGYVLVLDGHGRYRSKEHDSMVFLADGRWYWNSRQLNGRALNFIMAYENKTFPEAVDLLCNLNSAPRPKAASPPQAQMPPSDKPFVLPARAGTNRHLFAYLCKTRKIDREILSAAIRAGSIYQGHGPPLSSGQSIYNAVFVGRDMGGQAKSAFLRGLNSNLSYKNEISGSDKRFPFLLQGTDTSCLGIFESAIDALSHATIVKLQGEDHHQMPRMAPGGNFPPDCIRIYLRAHPEVQTLYVGFDNDVPGRRLRKYLLQILNTYDENRHITISDLSPPNGKDWSEYLERRDTP